jgi:hypothetical protein
MALLASDSKPFQVALRYVVMPSRDHEVLSTQPGKNHGLSAFATDETSSRFCSLDHCPMSAPSFKYNSFAATLSKTCSRPRLQKTPSTPLQLDAGCLC